MATISIHKAELLGAEQLAASLERRMANVTWYDENANPTSGGTKPQPVDAFICSASYEKACGGRSALVEKVRAMKAAKVLIISHDATLGFQVHSEIPMHDLVEQNDLQGFMPSSDFCAIAKFMFDAILTRYSEDRITDKMVGKWLM